MRSQPDLKSSTSVLINRTAGKKIIITCFRPDKVRLRRSSSAIRRDLIAERLSELDKQRNDLIVDVGLKKA